MNFGYHGKKLEDIAPGTNEYGGVYREIRDDLWFIVRFPVDIGKLFPEALFPGIKLAFEEQYERGIVEGKISIDKQDILDIIKADTTDDYLFLCMFTRYGIKYEPTFSYSQIYKSGQLVRKAKNPYDI